MFGFISKRKYNEVVDALNLVTEQLCSANEAMKVHIKVASDAICRTNRLLDFVQENDQDLYNRLSEYLQQTENA